MTNARLSHLLLLLIVFAFSSCDTKNDFEDTFKNYFIKYYGEDGKQSAVDMIVNADGTMLLLGTTTTTSGKVKILLLKVDAEGNVLWQNNSLGQEDEIAKDIEPTLDGSGDFIILSNIFVGKNLITGADEYNIHLIRISANGDLIPDSLPNSLGNNFGNSVTPISNKYVKNGGYMVTGYTTETMNRIPPSTGVRLTDIITILFNSSLDDTLWTSRINSPLVGEGVKVFESENYDSTKSINDSDYSDKPFYLFGTSDDFIVPGGTPQLNFDKWTLTENGILGSGAPTEPGSSNYREEMSISIKTNGNGFISVGTQIAVSGGTKSIFLATSQARASGLQYNPPIVTFPDLQSLNIEAVAVTPSAAGGRYLVLCNETSLSGTTNIWLSKVDISGNVYWSASFGAITQNDFAATVYELPNGQILVLGTIELETQNNKIVLMKLNANGEFLN